MFEFINAFCKEKAQIIILPLAIIVGAVLFVAPALAVEREGFNGPGPDLVTVSKAKTMWDDSNVVLKGCIVKSLGDEMYLFQDASGTVEVEIDHDIWRGQTIKPDDVVIISGEVEKSWFSTSIDVSSIAKQ